MADRIVDRLPTFAAWSGVGLAALSLLDPRLLALALPGLLLGWGGYLFRRGRPTVLLLAACLATTYAAVAWTDPGFGADSPSYYVYLRSAFFDHDLDFANEWAHWGYPENPLTPVGHRENVHAVGSACLWAPFFVGAHVYVLLGRVLGAHGYAADGYSLPYLRSAALGTSTWVIAGAFLLVRALRRRWSAPAAVLAVGGATLASTTPYYVLALPLMAHGLVFALASAAVWAWVEVRERPSAKRWAILGGLLGLLALTRWQTAVFALLLIPLVAQRLQARRLKPAWLLLSAGAAALAFLPQLLAWQAIYGTPFVMFQWRAGGGWSLAQRHGMDWASPHWVDVLLSADRGLLAWTPVAALGVVGLVLLARTWPGLSLGGLAVLAASVWVNGGVHDWAAADAFGGRRFDLVVPLFAVGLAELAKRASEAAQRRPWLLPAGALSLLVIWNFGLMRLYRDRVFSEAAPLERVAAAQAGQLRRGAEGLGFRLGGWPGRNLAYKLFVGEYFYWNLNLGGTIDVGDPTCRYLAGGWSTAREREGGPAFRMAYFPRACVRVPLTEGFDLRVAVTAKAPGALENQTLALWSNGERVPAKMLPQEWTDVGFLVPASLLHPGENLLCLEFSEHLRGEKGSQVAAAVARIQLP